MANDFYNHGAFPATRSILSSASLRSELDSIAAGFDKLPALAGNALKLVGINTAATALTPAQIYCDAAGNFGVGGAPIGAYRLTIDSGGSDNVAYFRGNNFSGQVLRLDAYSGSLRLESSVALALGAAGNEWVRVTTAGSVGMGTATPGGALHVRSTLGTTAIFQNPTANSGSALVLANDTGSGLTATVYGSAYSAGSLLNVGAGGTAIQTASNANLAITAVGSGFLALGTNSTARLYIDGTGNTGFGAIPAAGNKIDVAGNISLTGSMVGYALNTQSGAVAGATVPYYGVGVNVTHTGFTGGGLSLGGYYGIVLHVGGIERLRVKASGGVVFAPVGAPASPQEGEVYYDFVTKKHYGYNGTSWNAFY